MTAAASARIVAYLGGHGSFSEEACRRFVPAHQLMPLRDFASVARAVCQGSADLALLPVSNSRVGPIATVRQLLAHPELRVVGEEVLGVRLHLLGCSGSTVDAVRRVSSHPAALVQCEAYLGERNWTVAPTTSTSEAARQVAASNDPTHAAIASEAAAVLHGLQLLSRDLQGEAENVTRFAIVERRDQFA
ncbi:prephenate dehydratase [Sphingomonas kaistensis]|uniref:prephenate dehydratase n=1 Tax=Sphingomonas kaistensis TaxID=298708 RepID=A0A7X5Y7E6_9SPHN|nr:prephenate dehydratase [Sphingomonas kaistensis]